MQKIWELVCFFFKRFFEDRCSTTAASLAYTTLLTIVPLMMVGVSILSHFPELQKNVPALQHFIIQNFVANASSVLNQHIDQFLQQTSHLSVTDLIAFILTSVLLIYNMVHALNLVWHVKMERHFAFSFLIYLVCLLAMPLLFAGLVFVSSYVASVQLIRDTVVHPFLVVLPYLSALVVFTFFQWVLPSCHVKFRYALVAGIVTTLFFELARVAFAEYLKFFPTYRLVYGALATIPLFFIWIYLSWTIILLGAQLCHLLQHRKIIHESLRS